MTDLQATFAELNRLRFDALERAEIATENAEHAEARAKDDRAHAADATERAISHRSAIEQLGGQVLEYKTRDERRAEQKARLDAASRAGVDA